MSDGVMRQYQDRDWDVVDYDLFDIPGFGYALRGPAPTPDAGPVGASGKSRSLVNQTNGHIHLVNPWAAGGATARVSMGPLNLLPDPAARMRAMDHLDWNSL